MADTTVIPGTGKEKAGNPDGSPAPRTFTQSERDRLAIAKATDPTLTIPGLPQVPEIPYVPNGTPNV